MKTSRSAIIVLGLIWGGSSFADTSRNFTLTPYGFIKASTTVAGGALGSFNNINLSAPTHATAQTRSGDKTSRMSFQGQQSRFGTTLKKDNILGKFEFDLTDFNKSSPTTQMNPRVRIASVTYQVDSKNKFIFGQDWDLYSPVTSLTYDIVGLYFLAGNTGFMRQQFQYLHETDGYEFGGAVGLAGNNPNPTDGDLERSKTPTFSLRATKKLENGRMGISGIYTNLSYALENGTRHDSYAGNFFLEKTAADLQIKSELYYGQNTSNIGLLGIGKGTSLKDVREFGGDITLSWKMKEAEVFFGGVGATFIDNRSEISPFALNANDSVATTGIAKNILARIGWEHKFTPDLSWITELSRYETTSKLAANHYQLNVVPMIESGMLMNF